MVRLWLLALALVGALNATAAVAEEHRGGHEIEHWRHGEIARFHERDFDHWRTGQWFHGQHFGRPGWWWIVDGTWYLYPTPVYPYPDPYLPPTASAPAPPTPYWYYCASQHEYYPYVTSCPEPWQPVAATPAPPGR